jgi:hypothetical protein
VKRVALIRVVSLILLAACEALSQNRPSADSSQGLQFDGSDSPQVQRQEMRTWNSLPDAPSSIQLPIRAEGFPAFVNETGSSFTPGAVGVSAGPLRATEQRPVTAAWQPSLAAHYQLAFVQKKSSVFLGLYHPFLRQDARYHASTSDSFIGRAFYAASRNFVTRDDSGKTRVNTSYFLGVLTSLASATARRPYWARSSSGTYNNLGSTMSNAAGINVFHEFEPGIRQIVKGHAPKFVSRIADRIAHGQTKDSILTLSR